MTIDEKALEAAAKALAVKWSVYHFDRPSDATWEEHLDEARAAVEAYESAGQKEAEGWRDIASADRKLKAVIGYQATPGDWEEQMAICWPMGSLDGPAVWIGEGGLMPTHWRPLPEPPSALLSAGGAG